MCKTNKLVAATLILVFSVLAMSGCDIFKEDSSGLGGSSLGSIFEVVDYEALINEVSTEAMLFNVKIRAEHTEYQFPGYTNRYMSVGSGVIYRQDEEFSYVLTNDHVVDPENNNRRSDYYVIDPYGNEYTAELVTRDASCDLAILKFMDNDDFALVSVALATSEIEEGEDVISLGNPSGQMNSITLGEVRGKLEVEPTTGEDKILFPVIMHTCPLESGSSGGVLLNYDLELVGVNYATTNSESFEEQYGLAIPLFKVLEFLDKSDADFELPSEEIEQ